MTQKVRALSSGESEFYAQGSRAARGLLMKHICHEAGEMKKTLVLNCDSVASRGMGQRLGAGKCSHIEVKWLWLQQAMDEKKLVTKHVPTESNIADIGTKRVDVRQKMETDEPDGNAFGCCGGVSCAAASGTTETSIPDRGMKLTTRRRTPGSV